MSTLLLTSLLFVYFLTSPVHFTATGFFKNSATQGSNPLFNIMKAINSQEIPASNDDPRFFLCSYPVLAEVVQNLKLQVHITGNKRLGLLQEMWYTLKTACALHQLKRKKTPSAILSSKILVPNRLIVPDAKIEMACSALQFVSTTSCSLEIKWVTESTYDVFEQGQNRGSGQIDIPFSWDQGSFTLSGSPVKGKTYGLHFIPLEEAVLSLQQQIHISKDKTNPSLISVSFTHRDRHLATQIVNATMEQFETYLRNEGKKKITQQLSYLKQRQEETTKSLDELLEEFRSSLESHLDTCSLLSLEQELNFLSAKQSALKNRLLDLQTEIEHLSHTTLPFRQLLEELRKKREGYLLQNLSAEGARSLIKNRQEELDLLYLQIKQYDDSLNRLRDPDSEISALSNILTDACFRSHFEKIEILNYRLADSKNWAPKEREQLAAELEIEKQFLIQTVSQLKKGAYLREEILKKRIGSLEENLIFLLLSHYEQEESALKTVSQQAAHFPENWLQQQHIDFNTKLYQEMMITLTQLVEAKNIEYHLDYLLASLFKKASVPSLPDSPHLFLGTIVGSCAGLMLPFFVILFYTIWQGPRASRHNLISQGHYVVPDKEQVPILGLKLSECGPLVLLISPLLPALLSPLIQWLTKKGERVFLIDLSSHLPPSFMEGEEKESYLLSDRFQKQLIQFKETYDRIILFSSASVGSFEIHALLRVADAVIYGVTTERLVELDLLPATTFFFETHSEDSPIFPLFAIRPKLDGLLNRLKGSSSSSSRTTPWGRSP
jgi:hypothetical protein